MAGILERVDNPEGCGRSVAAGSADEVTGMTSPTMTWTRLTRALGSDHNPLRRRSDLMAAWLGPVAISVFLALGPLVAVGAIVWAHAGNAAARQAGKQLHHVPAVVLQSVPGPMFADGGANSWLTWTRARWTAGGQAHAGLIPAVSGTSAGATVPVWLDRSGHVRTPPLTAAQAGNRVMIAAVAALAALAVLLAGLGLFGRSVLTRRRIAAWEAEWSLVGPRWSHLA
jgi:hypothetical protein